MAVSLFLEPFSLISALCLLIIPVSRIGVTIVVQDHMTSDIEVLLDKPLLK